MTIVTTMIVVIIVIKVETGVIEMTIIIQENIMVNTMMLDLLVLAVPLLLVLAQALVLARMLSFEVVATDVILDPTRQEAVTVVVQAPVVRRNFAV